MREPVIREVSLPPEVIQAPESRIASLAAAVRSLRPLIPSGLKPPTGSGRWRLGLVVGVGLGVMLMALLSTEEPEPWVISGSPKLKQTETGEFVRWHTAEVAVTVDPSFEKLDKAARTAVLMGFDAWHTSHPGLPRVSYDTSTTPRKAERDGVNLVTYGKIAVPGHENALAITIGYSEPRSGKIVEVDMIFNSRHDFGVLDESPGSSYDDKGPGEAHSDDTKYEEAERCKGAYDLQAVVAHEAGHFFGLGEDREEVQATMYYKTGRCDVKQRDLVDSDVEAARTVYSAPLPEDSADTAACSISQERAPGPVWLALLAVFGLTFRRLRRQSAERRVCQRHPQHEVALSAPRKA